MSAIGNYVRLKRDDLERCLELADAIHESVQGRWLWKKAVRVGDAEFARAWEAALLDEVDFDYSGYALSDYFLAQDVVNGYPDPFESPDSGRLSKAFTAAFPITGPLELPALAEEKLAEFCQEEYGPDGGQMLESIKAAHRFYVDAAQKVDQRHAVVVIIS